MNSIGKINFENKFSKFNALWSPKIIAQLNDYHFKLAKLKGEFTWHSHEDTDEAFIVIEGNLIIFLRNKKIELHEGEMVVIPKGMEHKPFSEEECKILLIEKMGTINTGKVKNDLTAEEDIWI